MKLRILIVEDNPDLGLLWSKMLGLAGHEPVNVESGESARTLMDAAAPFDCVISDYILPDSNGLKLLEHLRAKCQKTPFLLVTGRNDASLREAIDADSRARMLLKPIDFKDINRLFREFGIAPKN